MHPPYWAQAFPYERECLACSFHTGPMRIGIFTRAIEFLRKFVQVCLTIFAFIIKVVLNFKCNFAFEFRYTYRCYPKFECTILSLRDYRSNQYNHGSNNIQQRRHVKKCRLPCSLYHWFDKYPNCPIFKDTRSIF